MEELMEEGNALLVLEWPEFLASQYYAEERLEVRLIHSEKYKAHTENVPPLKTLDNADNSCKSFRLAELEAHGSAAEALLGQLMPRLEQRFLPEQL
jgi:tRNA A37 threonylcarbamoyladenosine biosynthesis protein TsaE